MRFGRHKDDGTEMPGTTRLRLSTAAPRIIAAIDAALLLAETSHGGGARAQARHQSPPVSIDLVPVAYTTPVKAVITDETLRAAIVKIGLARLSGGHYTEHPAGSNQGTYINELTDKLQTGPDNQWCSDFYTNTVRAGYQQVGLEDPIFGGAKAGLPDDILNRVNINPESPKFPSLEHWAKLTGRFHSWDDLFAGKYVMKPGDALIFHKHVRMVTAVEHLRISMIGGNESDAIGEHTRVGWKHRKNPQRILGVVNIGLLNAAPAAKSTTAKPAAQQASHVDGMTLGKPDHSQWSAMPPQSGSAARDGMNFPRSAEIVVAAGSQTDGMNVPRGTGDPAQILTAAFHTSARHRARVPAEVAKYYHSVVERRLKVSEHLYEEVGKEYDLPPQLLAEIDWFTCWANGSLSTIDGKRIGESNSFVCHTKRESLEIAAIRFKHVWEGRGITLTASGQNTEAELRRVLDVYDHSGRKDADILPAFCLYVLLGGPVAPSGPSTLEA